MLIVERIFLDYSGSRVWDLRHCKVRVGSERSVGHQDKLVSTPLCGTNDPGFACGGLGKNTGRERRSVSEAVDQVAQILGKRDIQFRRERDNIFSLERYLSLSRLILGVKNCLNDRGITVPGWNSAPPLSVSDPAIRAERLLPEAARRSPLTAGSETDQCR